MAFLILFTTILCPLAVDVVLAVPVVGATTSFFAVTQNILFSGDAYLVPVKVKDLGEPVTLRVDLLTSDIIASVDHEISEDGLYTLVLQVPSSLEAADHFISVKAFRSDEVIFEQSSKVRVEVTLASFFVETEKPVYQPGQQVYFWIYGMNKNLLPNTDKYDEIFVFDPNDELIFGWYDETPSAEGVVERNFNLGTSNQAIEGNWRIHVTRGNLQKDYNFRVVNATSYPDNLEFVNVSMPIKVFEDEDLWGFVTAKNSTGGLISGICHVNLLIRLDGEEKGNISTFYEPFNGEAPFRFTMDEIREAINRYSAVGAELYVEAYVEGHLPVGWALAPVLAEDLVVHLIGDSARTLKPNQELNIQFAVSRSDGSRAPRAIGRLLTIQGNEHSLDGTNAPFQGNIIVNLQGVATSNYVVGSQAYSLEMTAFFPGQVSHASVSATRMHSETNSYVQLTIEDSHPKVGDDVKFSFLVTGNANENDFTYVVMSGGKVLEADEVSGLTFSVAMKREMFPECQVLVYSQHDGETLADSVSFHVTADHLNSVQLKEGTVVQDRLEVNVTAEPHSYVAGSMVHHDLYSRGISPFIQPLDIDEAMSSLDTNASRKHVWKTDGRWQEAVHFPAPSPAMDVSKVFKYLDLNTMSSDAVWEVSHTCNASLGWFPCMDLTCFHDEHRCHGYNVCRDRQDEMGCVYEISDQHTPVDQRTQILDQHTEEGIPWIIRSTDENGEGILRVHVRDEQTTWVSSGTAADVTSGYGFQSSPAVLNIPSN
ncbi:hypothetical protein CAPTEDRAFT_221040 [Capitella teleta]|uniref:Alpha-2-macroglobulin bait region domain-containing protein n=1 Tax=Capitella teleta TaxID=283909 RepID=R7TWG9_CAPTE|nr:hypothetical protein CAPTEDRAFT_221040 [Capitella teleta]|eukprot:ELT95781.1 hypothetical protein CAPTEDRAFT_221040 [Capitella teleta]